MPPAKFSRPAGGYTLFIWVPEKRTVQPSGGCTLSIWMKERPAVKPCRPAGGPTLSMHRRGAVGWQYPGSVNIALIRTGFAVITAQMIPSLAPGAELVRRRSCVAQNRIALCYTGLTVNTAHSTTSPIRGDELANTVFSCRRAHRGSRRLSCRRVFWGSRQLKDKGHTIGMK